MTWQPGNLPGYQRARANALKGARRTGAVWFVVCLDDPPFGRTCVACEAGYLDDPEYEAFEGSVVEEIEPPEPDYAEGSPSPTD